MRLYRIKNPCTVAKAYMSAYINFPEEGRRETRWGIARQEKQCGAPGEGGELRPFVRFEWIEDNCDAPYVEIEDFSPEAETWLEIDLHDPLVALQVLLRFREVFPEGRPGLDLAGMVVLRILTATGEDGMVNRGELVFALLTAIDPPSGGGV